MKSRIWVRSASAMEGPWCLPGFVFDVRDVASVRAHDVSLAAAILAARGFAVRVSFTLGGARRAHEVRSTANCRTALQQRDAASEFRLLKCRNLRKIKEYFLLARGLFSYWVSRVWNRLIATTDIEIGASSRVFWPRRRCWALPQRRTPCPIRGWMTSTSLLIGTLRRVRPPAIRIASSTTGSTR